jgi:heterodisulfide reductase subunit B
MAVSGLCSKLTLAINLKESNVDLTPAPNGVQQAYSSELWVTLAARNLALADEQALDIVTLCNGCYATLKHCRGLLKSDSRLQKRIKRGRVGPR